MEKIDKELTEPKWMLIVSPFCPTCFNILVKFIYSDKATNFCKISTVDLFCVVTVKSTMDILPNFAPFSEYMNFKQDLYQYQ